jgi:hypothetical protein
MAEPSADKFADPSGRISVLEVARRLSIGIIEEKQRSDRICLHRGRELTVRPAKAVQAVPCQKRGAALCPVDHPNLNTRLRVA